VSAHGKQPHHEAEGGENQNDRAHSHDPVE
jgi:hypothetical protein